ncbi:MAG: DUF4142 domain-containing protein [Alphaproteobacteria bacterium]|nr:DUF4142 domain-containing protein [Alphaproteobacteria bacterium]
MPRSAWLALSGIALLALAACGESNSDMPPPAAPPRVAPPPSEPPPAPPPEAPSASSDQQFVDEAAAAGMTEVDLGRLAREHAASREVRAFGAHMVADHTHVNNRLAALARHLKLTASSPTPDQSMHDQLAQASGHDFDRQYIDGQVKAHQDAVQLFESEAQNGQDARLKRFARETLPTLRAHLHRAEALARRLGGGT